MSIEKDLRELANGLLGLRRIYEGANDYDIGRNNALAKAHDDIHTFADTHFPPSFDFGEWLVDNGWENIGNDFTITENNNGHCREHWIFIYPPKGMYKMRNNLEVIIPKSPHDAEIIFRYLGLPLKGGDTKPPIDSIRKLIGENKVMNAIALAVDAFPEKAEALDSLGAEWVKATAIEDINQRLKDQTPIVSRLLDLLKGAKDA